MPRNLALRRPTSRNNEIKELWTKLEGYWNNKILKCYTPRNDLTNRQIDESKNISYNIINIDALIICCNDVNIHYVTVTQYRGNGEQLSNLLCRRENNFLYNALVSKV